MCNVDNQTTYHLLHRTSPNQTMNFCAQPRTRLYLWQCHQIYQKAWGLVRGYSITTAASSSWQIFSSQCKYPLMLPSKSSKDLNAKQC